MRVYHGWMVTAATAFVTAIVTGVTTSSFSLFVIPVSREFDLTRANMNMAIVIASIGNAVAAPFIGRLVDRFPNRPVLAVCGISLGLSMIVLGLSPWLWLSVFALAVLFPIGSDGTISITLPNMVAQWFRHYRARAMTLAALGLSLGGVVLPPVVMWGIEGIGWRMTLVVVGAVLACTTLLVAMLLRERPAPDEMEPMPAGLVEVESNSGIGGVTLPVAALLRSSPFWMCVIACSIVMSSTAVVLFSFMPIGEGSGISAMQATGLISIASVAGLLAKLGLAYFGDRADRSVLAVIACAGTAFMHGLFLFDTSYPVLIVCALILGTIYGAIVPLFQTLLVDLFSPASFGTARGLAAPMMATINAAFLRFAGEVYDRTGSYDLMFATLAILGVIAAVMAVPLKSHVRAAIGLSQCRSAS